MPPKQKKLKIGVVVDQLLPGGVQLAAIEQVKNLEKLGHEPRLLVLMRKKYERDFSYLAKGIPYQYLSDQYPPLLRRPIKFPIFSFFSTLHVLSPVLAPWIIKESDYDVLISHGTTTCFTTQALWWTRKIPYLAVFHDPMVYILEKCYTHTTLKHFFPVLKPLARFFERSFVNQAQETIIDSNVHAAYLKETYGVKAKTLPLGCQTLTKLPQKRGKHLLAFGRWQKGKNPQFLLELLKKFPRKKLILAGSWTNPQDFENFQRKVHKNGLAKRVEIVPHYTSPELKKICRRARFWIHAHFEAFGLAGLEAAGHGLPIIIPAKSGVTEIFSHATHGFFPEKLQLEEYQKYVRELLANERLAYKMGQAAHQVVKEKYSWPAHTKKLLTLIESSLDLGKKTTIWVLETGRTKGTSLSGGDKLMEPMAARLTDQYRFTIIVSRSGAKHWQQAPFKKTIKALATSSFDQASSPIPTFLTYLKRIQETNRILVKEAKAGAIYSSTNILPDTLPAWLVKGKRPLLPWVARIHHLIPPPHQREGKLVVNIVSYLMQVLSLWMIKARADIIIALNQRLKEKLVAAGFPKEKLQVLGAGIEFEQIATSKLKRGPKFDGVLLGRLHRTKGVFDTIPIWKQVTWALPEAKLAIIGDGSVETKKQLINKIRKAGLEKNIKVLGYLPYQDVFTILKQAGVFLFLDHEAGWGLAAAEAMACKLPVVGYDLGVLGDVFEKGYLTAPPFDQTIFAKKIISLLKNNALRKRLSQQAFSQAKKLDWQTTARKFRLILKRMEKS